MGQEQSAGDQEQTGLDGEIQGEDPPATPKLEPSDALDDVNIPVRRDGSSFRAISQRPLSRRRRRHSTNRSGSVSTQNSGWAMEDESGREPVVKVRIRRPSEDVAREGDEDGVVAENNEGGGVFVFLDLIERYVMQGDEVGVVRWGTIPDSSLSRNLSSKSSPDGEVQKPAQGQQQKEQGQGHGHEQGHQAAVPVAGNRAHIVYRSKRRNSGAELLNRILSRANLIQSQFEDSCVGHIRRLERSYGLIDREMQIADQEELEELSRTIMKATLIRGDDLWSEPTGCLAATDGSTPQSPQSACPSSPLFSHDNQKSSVINYDDGDDYDDSDDNAVDSTKRIFAHIRRMPTEDIDVSLPRVDLPALVTLNIQNLDNFKNMLHCGDGPRTGICLEPPLPLTRYSPSPSCLDPPLGSTSTCSTHATATNGWLSSRYDNSRRYNSPNYNNLSSNHLLPMPNTARCSRVSGEDSERRDANTTSATCRTATASSPSNTNNLNVNVIASKQRFVGGGELDSLTSSEDPRPQPNSHEGSRGDGNRAVDADAFETPRLGYQHSSSCDMTPPPNRGTPSDEEGKRLKEGKRDSSLPKPPKLDLTGLISMSIRH